MNIFLPEMLCIVLLAAENDELQRFEGILNSTFTWAYIRM